MINLLAKIFAWFRYVPYEERQAREAAKLKEAHDTAYFRMMVRGFSDIAIGAARVKRAGEPVSVPIAVLLYLGTSLGLLIMAAGAIIYAHTFLSI